MECTTLFMVAIYVLGVQIYFPLECFIETGGIEWRGSVFAPAPGRPLEAPVRPSLQEQGRWNDDLLGGSSRRRGLEAAPANAVALT